MNAVLAAVTIDTLRFVILVVFSVCALIISLYCLFFMVQEKSFWARIHSLGGGLRGIETHVAGVKDELSKRLDALEKDADKRIEAVSEEAQASAEKLAKAGRETARELERLRRELQGLQAELREALAGNGRLNQTVETLTGRFQQLRGDFDGLGVELRESVRQQVAGSFASVESTILSALDAVQEEILYGVSRPGGPCTPFPARRPAARPSAPSGDGDRQNIINVGPLFAGLPGHKATEHDGQSDAAEDADGGTDDAGPAEDEPLN